MTEQGGRNPRWWPRGAPKPSRWNELIQAHINHDANLIAEIEAEYYATEANR